MIFRAILMVVLVVTGAAQADDVSCPPAFSERLANIGALLGEHRSVDALKQLGELDSNLPEGCVDALRSTRILTANAMINQGRLTDADKILSEIESGSLPELLQARFFYTRGFLLYEQGLYRQARGDFESAFRLMETAEMPFLALVSRSLICATAAGLSVGDSEGREALLKCYQEVIDQVEASDLGAGEVSFSEAYLALGRLTGGEAGRKFLDKGLRLAATLDARAPALSALAVSYVDEDLARSAELLGAAQEAAETALAKQQNVLPLLHLLADQHLVRWKSEPGERAIADSLAGLDHIEKVRAQQSQPVTQASFLSVWAEAYQRLAGQILLDADNQPSSADQEKAFAIVERYRARVLAEALDRPAASDLASISAALAEDEALLVFQIADWEDVFGRFEGGSWLFVIRRQGTRVHRLAGRSEFARSIGMYLSLLARRQGDEGEAAARLYRELLAPALEDLPESVDKLILVPDGQLHLLPFGSLRAEADDPPIAMRYQLSTVPSASLWLRWRRAKAPPPKTAALILANPRPMGVPAAALRAELGPLPYAEEEGEALFSRLGGDLLIGSQASEASLKRRDLSQFGILHFAAHAVVDSIHPELSAVLLARSEDQDGDLQAWESAGLELQDKLIVLSACRSASGTVLRGEGVLSLARSFFEAGASTVVGSLRPLDDWEAKRFFDRFYAHLQQGTTVQGALHQTQRDLRQAGEPAAAWAGVVVLGDGSRVPLPVSLGEPPPAMLWWLLALVAGALILGLRRRRSLRPNRDGQRIAS